MADQHCVTCKRPTEYCFCKEEPFHKDLPTAPPWKPGERKRFVNNTIYYRSIYDYYGD